MRLDHLLSRSTEQTAKAASSTLEFNKVPHADVGLSDKTQKKISYHYSAVEVCNSEKGL